MKNIFAILKSPKFAGNCYRIDQISDVKFQKEEYKSFGGSLGICPSFVSFFLGKLPPKIRVEISSESMSDAKTIWVDLDLLRNGKNFGASWGYKKNVPQIMGDTQGMHDIPASAILEVFPQDVVGWQPLYVKIEEIE